MEFDDPQMLNRIQTRGGYRTNQNFVDSGHAKIPLRDIHYIIDKVCTHKICEQMKSMYFGNCTDEEVRKRLKSKITYNSGGRFQGGMDDLRYRLISGDIMKVTAIILD